MQPGKFPYHFLESEPGIQAEIYLPEKAVYGPVLYSALDKGLVLNYKSWFFESKERTEKLREFLAAYHSLAGFSEKQMEKIDADLAPVFRGYSLYKADGVYLGNNNEAEKESSRVVRIIFLPDYVKMNNHLSGQGQSLGRKQMLGYAEMLIAVSGKNSINDIAERVRTSETAEGILLEFENIPFCLH